MTPLIFLAALLAQVVAVHDGDTISVRINGLPDTVRLTHIDSPELPPRAHCKAEADLAERARAAMAALLPPGTAVSLTPNPGRPRDRYGRLLADVDVGGRDAGELLLRQRLARVYAGKRRKGWCP